MPFLPGSTKHDDKRSYCTYDIKIWRSSQRIRKFGACRYTWLAKYQNIHEQNKRTLGFEQKRYSTIMSINYIVLKGPVKASVESRRTPRTRMPPQVQTRNGFVCWSCFSRTILASTTTHIIPIKYNRGTDLHLYCVQWAMSCLSETVDCSGFERYRYLAVRVVNRGLSHFPFLFHTGSLQISD